MVVEPRHVFCHLGHLSCLAVVLSGACIVKEVCYTDSDCLDNRVCNLGTGQCEYECSSDEQCGFSFACVDHTCEFSCDDVPLDCPLGMASICGAFCIDIYEASRKDATESSAGSDSSSAMSQAGVLPWYTSDSSKMNREVAEAACQAADKRLCTPSEWEVVCSGLDGLNYCYSNTYDPVVCNGIDTFCECDPYPHCYDTCGAEFHVMPTGSFAGCTNAFGIFDINGNVWEVVDSSDGLDHYRGGAYNCANSEKLHACSYDATWNPSAKGFRCCKSNDQAQE
ncbi:MAG: SUMF1/EgtB/PvdO family nonheme iron enzyme [Proteobacteria bacterium]|nr:SUMF1/EgtB/PvdO family nonheme iron enzyme [Pseudomonadota bacterium]